MLLTSDEALLKLKEGNQRFVEATTTDSFLTTSVDHIRVSREQRPFAIILGCSDSRVPAELVFHCGLGQLFVIRVAGNIVAPSQIGSVEYACQQFGTQLVVVMGHSDCGAVDATVTALKAQDSPVSPNLAAIVERIYPAAHPIVEANPDADLSSLIQMSVRANVKHSVERMKHKSKILEDLVDTGKLRIVGAEYSLQTGIVDFFEE